MCFSVFTSMAVFQYVHAFWVHCLVLDNPPTLFISLKFKNIITYVMGSESIFSLSFPISWQNCPAHQIWTVTCIFSKYPSSFSYLFLSSAVLPVINCPSEVQVRENERLPNCTAEGNPSPEFTWFKGHQQVDPQSTLSRVDGGRYTVTARNSMGIVNETVDVEIWCKSLTFTYKFSGKL